MGGTWERAGTGTEEEEEDDDDDDDWGEDEEWDEEEETDIEESAKRGSAATGSNGEATPAVLTDTCEDDVEHACVASGNTVDKETGNGSFVPVPEMVPMGESRNVAEYDDARDVVDGSLFSDGGERDDCDGDACCSCVCVGVGVGAGGPPCW